MSDVIDHGFIHSIYSYDPNNIAVEFSHNASGIDIRKNPGMGDAQPVKLALEGSEPQKNKWPKVKRATPIGERIVYPGVGSELFHGYRNGSCTVCTDLTAEKADLSFGGVGLKEGYTTILARTGLGLELFKDAEDRVVH